MFNLTYEYKGRTTENGSKVRDWVRKDFPNAEYAICAAFGIAYSFYENFGKENEKHVATVYYAEEKKQFKHINEYHLKNKYGA